jgi:hypothetical protein
MGSNLLIQNSLLNRLPGCEMAVTFDASMANCLTLILVAVRNDSPQPCRKKAR